MDSYHNIELHLQAAPVLYYASPPTTGGAHPGKLAPVLAGGFQVLAKPSHTIDNGFRAVTNEAAAWQAIKVMGYAEMMGTTVLRTFPTTSASVGTIWSAQVMWHASFIANPTAANLSESDVLKAGVFDFVINNTDRGPDGHNWLAVECAGGGGIQLKLFDHAFCWDWPGRSGESVFVTMARQKPLPSEVLAGVERLEETVATGGLADFLDPQQRLGVGSRCRVLLAGGRIPANGAVAA